AGVPVLPRELRRGRLSAAPAGHALAALRHAGRRHRRHVAGRRADGDGARLQPARRHLERRGGGAVRLDGDRGDRDAPPPRAVAGVSRSARLDRAVSGDRRLRAVHVAGGQGRDLPRARAARRRGRAGGAQSCTLAAVIAGPLATVYAVYKTLAISVPTVVEALTGRLTIER